MGNFINSNSKSLFLPYLAAIFVVLVWAETFVTSKLLLQWGLAPADIYFYRISVAYVCIWLLCHKRLWTDSRKDELTLMLMGVFGGSMYFFSENTALKYSTAANVSIIVCVSPLVTSFLVSLLYKKEKPTHLQFFGSFIAFVGMALIVMNGNLVLHLNPLGDFLAFLGAFSWGCYSLFSKRMTSRYDSLFLTRKVFGYGLLSTLPYFLFVCPLKTDAGVLGQNVVWLNLLYLALVPSLLCFFLWNWALPKLGTIRTTNMLYIQPFFTMLIAAWLLCERITPMAVVGAVVLTVGMFLAIRQA